MKVPMAVLKAMTFWPAALVSVVLFVVAMSLVPPVLSLPLVLAMTAALVVLACGRLEGPTVELLTGARAATVAEQKVIESVVDGLGRLGITDLGLLVRRRQRASTRAVTVLGSRSVVLTPGLVEAVYRGRVATQEIVALAAHTVMARRARRPRAELVGLVVTTPWRAVARVFHAVAAAFSWLPFMPMAWALRGVVAVICVLQSVAEGRAAVGLLGGATIALTYMVPAADRALQTRAVAIGDQFVVDHRLGGVLAQFLTRQGHPITVDRLRRLEQQPPQPVPSPSAPLATQLSQLGRSP